MFSRGAAGAYRAWRTFIKGLGPPNMEFADTWIKALLVGATVSSFGAVPAGGGSSLHEVALRIRARCADSASPYRSPRRLSSAVEPSMSLNSIVMVPAGNSSTCRLSPARRVRDGPSGAGSGYGTQFGVTGGEFGPCPIGDPKRLDDRRADMGLELFAVYEARMRVGSLPSPAHRENVLICRRPRVASPGQDIGTRALSRLMSLIRLLFARSRQPA
jgi:hypothetical protein